ncbi:MULTISPECIES: glycosyltransferase [unclassified Desulfovibrio]|uniref:glycosyltransferase n=1 Tax=unclassified Desulfovibrio TaxID=2593640 RepID=UPI0013EA1BAC|nr:MULTISPECIES: glycosyltransferase [unclassified Desulfovibrio]
MHILLMALQQEGDGSGAPLGTPAQLARVEAEQALAMAEGLREDGRFTPLLVCRRGAWLHQRAEERGLSLLAVGGAGDVAGLVRLWRWQRRCDFLIIQTVGEEALGLSRRVLGMRKKGSAHLAHAFFVRPPAPETARGRAMRAASRVFCGSEHVRARLHELWAGMPEKRRPDALLDLLGPGLPLAEYVPAPETGRHVFGMGESLGPDSGALAVVRAMAALWQREDLPPWEVRMFGAGPRFAEILHEAESLGVAGRLSILGGQPPEVLGQCSAWLAPGTSPEEVPQTLWAGIALGVPLICALSPLHRERLAGAPPHAAVRIRESDPQALARAMIAVMRDERLRARLRGAGESLRPGIGLEAMAGRFLAFCGEVAAGLEGTLGE